MSKETFIENNQYELFGLKFLFFKGASPTKLIVSFGSMGGGDKYSRWSWFWNNGNYKDSYLFLLDKKDTYFLGEKGDRKVNSYRKAIEWALAQAELTTDDLVMLGNSMGGYAALYYGFLLNAQSIFVGNPQVSRESALTGSKTWLKCMDGADEFLPIKDLYEISNKNSNVLIEVGSHTADIIAAKEIFDFYENKSKIIIRMHSQYPHLFDLPKKMTIEKLAKPENFEKESTCNVMCLGSFLSHNTVLSLKKELSVNIVASSKFSRVDVLFNNYFKNNVEYLNTLNFLRKSPILNNESLPWVDSQLEFYGTLHDSIFKKADMIDLIVLDNYIELTRKLVINNDCKFLLNVKENNSLLEYESELIGINELEQLYHDFVIFLLKKFKNAKIVLINAPLDKHKDSVISSRSILFNSSFKNKNVFIIHSLNNELDLYKNGVFNFDVVYDKYKFFIREMLLN